MKQQTISKIFLLGIMPLAAFLLFYKLDIYMPFIGDQGWFYLSARDMLLTGHIPLLGITSSHTWLHQGPLWTYLLAIALWVGNFNPLAGGYFTAAIGLVTVWLVYKIASEMFSPGVGIISSLLYATSPLIIQNARTPYHTSFIATFVLVWFYTLYKWVNGFKYGFPLVLLLFAILYNLELSTVMLIPVFLLVCFYSAVKRAKWIRSLLDYKLLILSVLALCIPMIPMILYDVHHGYPQTIKFALWLGYNAFTFLGLPKIHPTGFSEPFPNMVSFASALLGQLIFYLNSSIAWLLLIISFVNLIFLNKSAFQKKKYLQSYALLLLLFFVPFVVYIADRTNSMAYWPLFYPSIIYMLSLFFDRLLSISRLFYLILLILFFIVYINVEGLLQSNYLLYKNGITYAQRLAVAKEIMQKAKGKPYTIHAIGPGSQYANFALNYTYLTWWLGHGPSDKPQKLQFLIGEDIQGVHLKEQVVNIKN